MGSQNISPPYWIATAEQSQLIDADTIQNFGIDGFTLMEIAGAKTAQHLLEIGIEDQHGVFLCGKGNNAGDALVVARYLIQYNLKATIVFLSGIDDLSTDTHKNLTLLKKISENTPETDNLQIITSWQDFEPSVQADFIVDGMLGTGLSSDLRGDYRKAAVWANSSGYPIYAIDIPTGINADSGQVMGTAVKATVTYTYGIHKQGCFFDEGFDHSGTVIFCELPFPNYLKKNCSSYIIDRHWIKQNKKTQPRHKYEAGVLYIIAGSKGLTGAAVMAAQSAWAEGLGAVIIVCPDGNLMVYEKNLPQIIKKSVGSKNDAFFRDHHLDSVFRIVREKKGTVLIGPGLGREDGTITFTRQFLQQFHGKVIIDADALWALSQTDSWEKPTESEWILTPHPGELSTLAGSNLKKSIDRIDAVKKMASAQNITLVSKGLPVIIGTRNGDTYLTAYDTRQFSRAGFGDVLAGKIAAKWSLGYSALESSMLGLLNGKQKKDSILTNNPNHILEPKDLL